MIRKMEKYNNVRALPSVSYGGSTGDPPIQVNIITIIVSTHSKVCLAMQ